MCGSGPGPVSDIGWGTENPNKVPTSWFHVEGRYDRNGLDRPFREERGNHPPPIPTTSKRRRYSHIIVPGIGRPRTTRRGHKRGIRRNSILDETLYKNVGFLLTEYNVKILFRIKTSTIL